ncbi:MAG: sigma-70 family RNA polymerase sigma factor, partial [Verrucomicrobiota bacterium]
AQVSVLGYLNRMTGTVADAHDLLQQTNLTAWKKRQAYTAGTNIKAWMISIARNHHLNHLRRTSRRTTVPLLDEDVASMVESRHEEREKEDARKRRLLQLCLADLSDRHRDFVRAFYLEGQSQEDIAIGHNLKANAVAQLLHRARQNLIQCVKRKAHLELDSESPPTP